MLRDRAGDLEAARRVGVGRVEDARAGRSAHHLDEGGDVDRRARVVATRTAVREGEHPPPVEDAPERAHSLGRGAPRPCAFETRRTLTGIPLSSRTRSAATLFLA